MNIVRNLHDDAWISQYIVSEAVNWIKLWWMVFQTMSIKEQIFMNDIFWPLLIQSALSATYQTTTQIFICFCCARRQRIETWKRKRTILRINKRKKWKDWHLQCEPFENHQVYDFMGLYQTSIYISMNFSVVFNWRWSERFVMENKTKLETWFLLNLNEIVHPS